MLSGSFTLYLCIYFSPKLEHQVQLVKLLIFQTGREEEALKVLHLFIIFVAAHQCKNLKYQLMIMWEEQTESRL